MVERNQKDWRELCTAVVNETDSNELKFLVQKLVEALDAGRQNKRHSICSLDAIATNREAAKEVLYGGSLMGDALRITVEEQQRRIEAGEDFTVIDVRNPNAWAESDTMLPEAIRVPLDTH